MPVQPRHADGCGGSSTGAGHVEVYLSVHGPQGERPFCPGDALHPEDALVVRVEVVREAHMHLLYVNPRGESGALERQDTKTVTREGAYRIPSGLLTQHVGEAQLFLIVSLQPLAETDPDMHALWRTIRETGTFVDRQGRLHPPDRAGTSPRPVHFDPGADLHANFDASGVAMLGLSLRATR